jgi:hypothetical protein
MTDTTASAIKTPWWFWLVCALGLFWNGFGAFDFAMSVIQGDAYYRSMKMTDEAITYMHSYPAWMYVVWFAGTWGALIGTILLIARRRWAYHAFIISLVGFLLSLVYAYFLSGHPELAKPMLAMHITIFIGCVFFIWFASFSTRKGLLR